MLKKFVNLKKRHYRIRKKICGTADTPRVHVKRSLANLFVQVIDDVNGKTLASLSTASKEFKAKATYGGNVKAAVVVGELLAEKMKEQGITKIAFDRSGYQYHGRVKSLADSLRKNGIAF